MSRVILKIYDCFRKHPAAGWCVFVVLTVCMAFSMSRLGYKEDISDFLPLDEKNQQALSVYQDISGANRIYAIISARDSVNSDPQELADGIESFSEYVEASDSLGYVRSILKQVDMDKMLETADIVYDNLPYFLTESDYARMDSLLRESGYAERRLEEDKQMLLFPTSGVVAANISRDPLGLFAPVAERLGMGDVPVSFEMYDGYILTPDMKRGIVILESSFGSSESEQNGRLVELLENAVTKTEADNDNLDIHIIGGPVIAVANADRIKSDSILAVSIAGVLILLLLIYVFRNVRNILLILVSVGWGWLFAMGGIALYYDSVSIIVIGIASVILGIAVNYPLHLIDHLKDSEHPRSALKEIISPLVVGNVTTVGAFLCLVPLNAPALHDLGLFSSLLLVGTILFVLLFLPHAVKIRQRGERRIEPKLIEKIAGIRLESSRVLVLAVLVLTAVFGYFSLQTEFDTDMRNINYMTPGQREDMEYFSSLTEGGDGKESLYVVSNGKTWDEALRQAGIINRSIDAVESEGLASRRNGASFFMKSDEEIKESLKRWNDFLARHYDILDGGLRRAAVKAGFSEEAFLPFEEIVGAEYGEKGFEDFRDFISSVFPGSISEDKKGSRKSVVEALSVDKENVDKVKEKLSGNQRFDGILFDVKSMNGSIANTLSDDFNYIGIACGCIVFLFLWLSLGRLELAIISFMPMAFSWVWILGIMAILGIKFNIVNIILATFIFGQGDDYTIFMTEGLSYELAYGKKVLTSYKNSIIVSALIMFVGIGTLLFAKHPAMRSLGEVTVVGMLSVVLMAYLFPPLMFRWLTEKDGRLRRCPLTIKGMIEKAIKRGSNRKGASAESRFESACKEVYGRYLYKGIEIERKAKRDMAKCRDMQDAIMSLIDKDRVAVVDRNGQGELALLLSLLETGRTVYCYLPNAEERMILRGCIRDFCKNVIVVESEDEIEKTEETCVIEF